MAQVCIQKMTLLLFKVYNREVDPTRMEMVFFKQADYLIQSLLGENKLGTAKPMLLKFYQGLMPYQLFFLGVLFLSLVLGFVWFVFCFLFF